MVDEINYEVAIVFKRVEEDKADYIIPIRIIEGNYDEDDCMFVDKKGYSYHHILETLPGNCFGLRQDIAILAQQNPKKSLEEIKKDYLNEAKSYYYYYSFVDDNKTLSLVKQHKKTKKITLYTDMEINQIGLYARMIDLTEKPKDMDERDFVRQKIQEIVDEVNLEQDLNHNTNQKECPKVTINKKELKDTIQKKIIGQDEAIKKILTVLYEHYNSDKDSKSENMLVVGPTGVGKTQIFRTISELIKVPCIIEDANDFTTEGYVGKSVSSIINDLLAVTDGDVEMAEKSILIIDEIDKLAPINQANPESVATIGVQQALLKLIEDGKYITTYKGKNINFNAKKLLVAGLGAFSKMNEDDGTFSVGFNNERKVNKIKKVTPNEVEKYGLIPELLGRFPNFILLNNLTEEDLYRILKESDLSILRKKEKFFAREGIKLSYNDEVLRLIAKEAAKLNEGARSLDKAIINMLFESQDLITDYPGMYKELELLPETVTNPKKYILRK